MYMHIHMQSWYVRLDMLVNQRVLNQLSKGHNIGGHK